MTPALSSRGRIDPPFGKERSLELRKIVISPFPVIPDAGAYISIREMAKLLC